MSIALENQNKELKAENESYKEALIEVRACLDSFYDNDTPRRMHPELRKFSGLIQVMDKVTHEALKGKV